MLTLLKNYALDHKLVVEPGFAPKTVKWAVNFDSQGKFLGVVELGDSSDKKNTGREFICCPDLPINVVAGGGGRSHFLVETTQVVALLFQNEEQEKKNREKTLKKRAFFLDLLRDAGEHIPELRMASDALANESITQQVLSELISRKAKATDKATVCIDTKFPVENDLWHPWWRKYRKTLSDGHSEKSKMRCFVSGEMVEPMDSHLTISGLASVGGNPIGDRLVCFDKDAFQSYNLSSSQNCAVSEDAVSAYRAALNDIIAKHSQKLAGAKIAHWFTSQIKIEEDPLEWISSSPQHQEVSAQELAEQLLTSIRSGKRADLANNSYYALTMSGAGGRVMIRDWMQGSFEELVENINAWFSDLQIVSINGVDTTNSPKFINVLGATVRVLDDLTNPFVASMWRTAVKHDPIPAIALSATIARTKIDMIKDDSIRPISMGLMKAYHIRKYGGNCKLTIYLNEDHPSAAYQCGRLMAMLAKIQYAALGNVGANVVQRFYAAASATPALVLGRLVRLSQFHLGKLDPGLAHWYEARIADIWSRLNGSVPKSLSLEEQSLFALGYYQQIAFNNAGKQEKIAKSENNDIDISEEENV